MTTAPPIYLHESREANLLAAKHAVKARRHSMLMRLTNTPDDVIDVVEGGAVLERHVCKRKDPFCVEDLAMYQ